MTVFQIVAISVLGAGALVAVGFTIAFMAVSLTKEKVRETYRESKVEKAIVDEVNEIDLDAMLAKLEEVSSRREKTIEQPKVEPVKPKIIEEPKVEEFLFEEDVVDVPEEIEEDLATVIEKKSDVVLEENSEPIVEEKISEIEVKPANNEEFKFTANKNLEERKGPEFDYRIRLEKIKESQAKIDRDLDKTTRAILKYERTIRRKERNQKMLDRRALELTNLNLLMYSVTDIKNVDAEKKTRQEELTKHIAELKASIQDADNYLEANKEKHENNIKLSDYLTHEKTRYAEEVKELETAIASGKYFDDRDGFNN